MAGGAAHYGVVGFVAGLFLCQLASVALRPADGPAGAIGQRQCPPANTAQALPAPAGLRRDGGGSTVPEGLRRWWGLSPEESARCGAAGRRPRNVVVAFSAFKRSTSNGTKLMLASFNLAARGRGNGGAVSKGLPAHAPLFEMVLLSNRQPDHERFVALQEWTRDMKGVTVLSIADMQAAFDEQQPWAKSKQFLNMRPLYMRAWLHENPMHLCPDDRVAVSDEDLVFKGDPFDIFDAMPEHSLYLFSEKTNFTNNDGLNAVYVDIASGSNATRDFVKTKQVFCFGFAVGEAWAIRELHDRVAAGVYIRGFEAADETKHALDQGMLNILAHAGALDDLSVRLVYNEEPWVTHLTSQLGVKGGIPFDELVKTRRVVHQYKWANDVRSQLTKEYGFEV